jgi:hypothetical protein
MTDDIYSNIEQYIGQEILNESAQIPASFNCCRAATITNTREREGNGEVRISTVEHRAHIRFLRH